jgi:hypothetical protein
MLRSLIILLLLSASVAAFAGWSVRNSDASAPVEDLQRLSGLADTVMSSGGRMIVVTVRGSGKHAAVEQLIGEMQSYGSQTTMMENGERTDFALRLTVQSTEEAASWMEAASELLTVLELTPSWNINMQGWLQPGMNVDVVWEKTQRYADATAVEAYEDIGTSSVSYRSERFESSVNSGGKEINLQAAAHLSTQTNEWRITLGTPVILIEY